MAAPKLRTVLHKTNVGIVVTALRRLGKEEFRQMAAVASGSYAAELVDRFHEFLLARSIDLRQEYEEYYMPEYATIAQFLYHKYAMAPKHIRALMPSIERGSFLGLVRKTWGRDWQMQGLIEDSTTGLTTMMKAVNASWAEASDEN
jgi:hypothetical protein